MASTGFLRRVWAGVLAGMLVFAACNAVSYFVRSDSTKLKGGTSDGGRIGFPWMVWEANGRGVGSFYLGALVQNIAIGLATSAAAGIIVAIATRGRKISGWTGFNAIASERVAFKQISGQFSLRGLFFSITVLAAILALGQKADERTKLRLLIALYWIGPALLMGAYLFARLCMPGAGGNALVAVAALAACAAAVLGVGSGIGDFTQVLLGLFIYWTPQCVLLAGGLAAWAALRPTTSSPRESRN